MGAHPGEEAPAPKGWEVLLHGGNTPLGSEARARVALLAGDSAPLRRHASEPVRGPWMRASTQAARGYAAWLEGADEEARACAKDLESAEVSGFRIDGLLLQALGELERDPKKALQAARRASKDARAASFTHWEFLAALVLIRARRYNDQPVAAAVVSQALRKWAPPAYERWLDWEYSLCNAGDEPARWMAQQQAHGWPSQTPLAADFAQLQQLSSTSDTPFSRGEVHTAPRGLGGLLGVRGALVYGAVGAARRRLPFSAVGDVDHDLRNLDSPRQLALVGTLLMRGPRTLAEAFQDAYHLKYVPGRHAQTFRVLLHRTRKMLPANILLEREGEVLSLRASGTVALHDPRTVPFEEGAILSLFQQSSRLTAAEVAEARATPKRTVQDALRRLVDQGVLRLEGRSTYVCEDTVFSEPTRATRRGP